MFNEAKRSQGSSSSKLYQDVPNKFQVSKLKKHSSSIWNAKKKLHIDFKDDSIPVKTPITHKDIQHDNNENCTKENRQNQELK